MIRWYLLHFFLIGNILAHASNNSGEVERCLIEEDYCDCLDSFRNSKISKYKALALYLSVGYNCENYGIKQKKTLLDEARLAWDSIGYDGYRYLNSYYIVADYYKSQSYNIDSLRKYCSLLLSFQHDNSKNSILYYHKAKLDYISTFSRYGDSYHTFDLYDEYINSEMFKGVDPIDKATTYAGLVSASGNIFSEVYIDDALRQIEEVRLFIDSIESIVSLEEDISYLASLERYLLYSEAYCRDKKKDYSSALEGYQEYFENLNYRDDMISPAIVANSIATMHHSLGEYELSLSWANRSVKYFESQGDTLFNYIPYLILVQAYNEMSILDSVDYFQSIGIEKSLNGVLEHQKYSVNDLEKMASPEYVIRYMIEGLSLDLDYLNKFSRKDDIYEFDKNRNEIRDLLQLIGRNQEDWLSIYNLKKIADQFFAVSSLFDLKHSSNEELFWNCNNIKASYYEKSSSTLSRDFGGVANFRSSDFTVVQYAEIDNYLYGLTHYNGNFYSQKLLSLDSLADLSEKLMNCIQSQCGSYSNLVSLMKVLIPTEVKNLKEILIVPSAPIVNLPLEYIYSSASRSELSISFKPYLETSSPEIDRQVGSEDVSLYLDSSEKVSYILKSRKKVKLDVLRGVGLEGDLLNSVYDNINMINASDAFISEALKSQILHFSGHFIYDNAYPNESSLVFRKDTLVDFVTLDDIRQVGSMNNLVILNACQTGEGEELSHEGVLSLGNCFLYSGADAVIGALWPVNDQASAIVMNLFHKELKKGKRKDEALRQAKLTYLDQADPEYQHPYYWAAFVAMGDMSPLFDPYKKWKRGGGVLMALLLGGVGYRKYSALKIAA